jgi:hypothetical protein
LLGATEGTTMTVDEQRLRQSLHTRLAETLGGDEAALLMEYLPPVGWADIVRRSDLRAEVAGVRGEIAGVRGEVSELRGEMSELRGEMGELRGEMGELRGEMGELRGELRASVAALRAEMTELKSQLLMWLVPTVVGSVGIAATLARIA